MSGDFDGERWMVSVEESGGFTLLAVEINGLDQGAVVVSDSSWYHAEVGSIVILTGGLPSRTTQAVAATVDGASLALCPFGDGDLLVAAGAVYADQIVDLEFRQGGAVVAAAHVQELRRLSDAELFAFNVTPLGAVDGGGTGLVRSPGAELTFDDDDTGGTEP